ncbi:MAG: AzlD domain-containing protein [Synergistaceae bacterium]|nr:AzlD domain-containing protein [Synergistaceae bacterium]
MPEIIYISILMMLVTAPSRLLPPFLLAGRRLPPLLVSVLNYIPFAVIGSMIFPDSFSATGSFYSSAAGTIAAFVMGWYNGNILVVLASSIAAAFIAAQLGF